MIVNDISKLPENLLDAFVIKIRFDYMNRQQKQLALQKVFGLQGINELDDVNGLVYADFLRVKDKTTLLNIVDKKDIIKLLKEEADNKPKFLTYSAPVSFFDINLVNSNVDLMELTAKLEKSSLPFTVLISGPAGTGKSYYLRYLAHRIGKNVIEKTAAELFSRYQGEPAKNILNLFKEAEEKNAVIIFDEIDSFLSDKHLIRSPHEARLVNECLVQLENHPYPVGGTTNYLENMEKACIRRFKIQAKFDYLRKDQYAYVYRKTFGFQPPKDIEQLMKLTPAIFSLAAEKVSLENVSSDEKRVFEIFLGEAKKSTVRNILEETDKTYENILINNAALYTTPVSDNYNKILTGFVKVITDTGHGSGFFISNDGFILTNKHVVKEEKLVTIELFSGRQVAGEVIRTNSLDIALIKISAENKVYSMPIRTREINISSTVFSFGNPGNKNQVLSKGCITRYTNVNNTQRIETDCFMDCGSSGGPLLDEYGNVIGVNVEGWTKGNANLGINLHLSINDALRVLNIKVKEADNIK